MSETTDSTVETLEATEEVVGSKEERTPKSPAKLEE